MVPALTGTRRRPWQVGVGFPSTEGSEYDRPSEDRVPGELVL